MQRDLYVLLGDAISSKKLENRSEFQKNIIRACEIVNQRYSKDVYADFNILKGTDEIGAVLNGIDNFYEMILDIFSVVGLNVMRFVLVKGNIDTGLDQREVSRMDGPVFHEADGLMKELKKEKLLFKISTGDEIFDKLVAGNINLIYLIESKWSPKKIEIIKEYKKNRDQREVAGKLGMKQQDVSYHILSTNCKEVQKITEDLQTVIKLYATEKS